MIPFTCNVQNRQIYQTESSFHHFPTKNILIIGTLSLLCLHLEKFSSEYLVLPFYLAFCPNDRYSQGPFLINQSQTALAIHHSQISFGFAYLLITNGHKLCLFCLYLSIKQRQRIYLLTRLYAKGLEEHLADNK